MAGAIAGFCEGRAQGHATAGTGHHAAQGEVIADIFSARGIGRPLFALLYLFEGLHRYQWLVLRFQPVNAVVFGTDVACVSGMRKNLMHTFLGDVTFAVAWEFGEGLKETQNLSLGAEAA